MRTNRVIAPIVLWHGVAVVLTGSWGALVVNDGFEETTHPSGDRQTAVGSGLRLFTRDAASAITATIADDATFESRALIVADKNTPASTSKPVIGLLPLTLQLTKISDFVTLTFDVHFLNNADVMTNAANFRFGIFSSAGTPVTGDSQPAASDNDRGYYVQVGSGGTVPTAANTFYNEAGGTFPILGGADRTSVTASSAGVTINNNSVHSALFTITRTSANTVSLSFSLDGGTAITGTDSTANLRTSFDEIAFSNGFQNPGLSYAIDNISINSSVPEPGSATMVAGGAVLLVGLRRRNA